jgi:hypothetical protein
MSETVREALRRYHEANGFKGDAMTAETLQIRVLGHVGDLPNPRFQRALLARHDLHHVATGYGTDLRGEAEMGAWELAAGPKLWIRPPRWSRVPGVEGPAAVALWMGLGAFVWVNNAGALLLGVLAPIRTARAFVRGLFARSLYRDELDYEALLDMTLEALRARLGVRG